MKHLKPFAFAVAMASAAQSSLALEQSEPESVDVNGNTEYSSTYWGLGIGTALGAVIAGPPGAAIGASLGGSLGWGQDKNEHLDKAEEEQAFRLQELSTALQRSQQKVAFLSRENAEQSARLSGMVQKHSEAVQHAHVEAALADLLTHYAQEIYFRFAEASLPDYAQQRLDRLADFLLKHSEIQVTLTGFTDPVGSIDYNRNLAKRRVESVRSGLLERGIGEERFRVSVQGEASRGVKEKTSGNHVLDRRVAIEFSLNDITPDATAELTAGQSPLASQTPSVNERSAPEKPQPQKPQPQKPQPLAVLGELAR